MAGKACLCAFMPDLAVVPMGGDGLDEQVFASLEIVRDHGGALWWLYLSRCSACGQDWMVAQEERIYDDYYLRRLDREAAERIVAAGEWPDAFITYERVLKIGRSLSRLFTYLDPLSPALIDTARDLREARPDISILEISHLLGIPPGCAAQLFSV